MAFLPTNYQAPVRNSGSGEYFKVLDGKNKVRVLSDAITGYVYWNNQGKPVRTHNHPGEPQDIRLNDDGKPDRVKFFWAVVVWDYAGERVAVWEIPQASLQDQIQALAEDEDWGHPNQYDLSVTRSGKGLDTKYSIVPGQKKPISGEIGLAYESANIDLSKLMSDAPPRPQESSKQQSSSSSRNEDWDRFLSKLDRATDDDEINAAAEWISTPQRLASLKEVFGDKVVQTIERYVEAKKLDEIPF